MNKVIKSIGCSSDAVELERLHLQAQKYIQDIIGQTEMDFYDKEAPNWFALVYDSIESISLAGPELILGKLFDQIGFSQIDDVLFRHLVISRIIQPGSKLKTARDLLTFYGIDYSVDTIYRYMDKLESEYDSRVQQISYAHTLSLFDGILNMIFYDVTTIYFEAEKEDDLRITGFSKDGKHQHPQILLGLLVSANGYPLAYDIFLGNTYEGYTMISILERFKKKFKLSDLIVVADAGLMTKANVEELEQNGYQYILGARIKNESATIKSQILNLRLENGKHAVIYKTDNRRLIIQYSEKRAKKDAFNRSRGLKRLENALKKGKLSKKHLNNRAYNKYLQIDGDIEISIDYGKFEADNQWDGLKGFLTNSTVDAQALISNYRELWKIEKAFRISKTDLRIRPIYHRLERRIKSHICISFAAYKVYKELERQLVESKSTISVQLAIEHIKSLRQITISHPQSLKTITKVFKPTKQQIELLKIVEN